MTNRIASLFLVLGVFTLLTCEDRSYSNPVDPRYDLTPPRFNAAWINQENNIELRWENPDGNPAFFNLFRKSGSTDTLLSIIDGQQFYFIDPSIQGTNGYSYRLEAYWYGRSSLSKEVSVQWAPYNSRHYNFGDITVGNQIIQVPGRKILLSAQFTGSTHSQPDQSMVALLDRFGNQRWLLEFTSSSPACLGHFGPDSLIIGLGSELKLVNAEGEEYFAMDLGARVIKHLVVQQSYIAMITENSLNPEDYYLTIVDVISQVTSEVQLFANQDVLTPLIVSNGSGSYYVVGQSRTNNVLLQMRSEDTGLVWSISLGEGKLSASAVNIEGSALVLIHTPNHKTGTTDTEDAILNIVRSTGDSTRTVELDITGLGVELMPYLNGYLVLSVVSGLYLQEVNTSGAIVWRQGFGSVFNPPFQNRMITLDDSRICLLMTRSSSASSTSLYFLNSTGGIDQ